MHGVEAGAMIPPLRARDALVPVDRHDLVPRACGGRPEFALLVLGRLVVGGNPKVDRSAHLPLPLRATNLVLFGTHSKGTFHRVLRRNRQSVSKGLFGTWLSRKRHRVDRRQGAPEVTIGPLTSKSPAV